MEVFIFISGVVTVLLILLLFVYFLIGSLLASDHPDPVKTLFFWPIEIWKEWKNDDY